MSACHQIGYSTQIDNGLGATVWRFLDYYDFPKSAPRQTLECPWPEQMQLPATPIDPAALIQPQSIVLEGHLLCEGD